MMYYIIYIMNNNAEVLPIAYEVDEVDEEKVNNATIATIFIDYEPNIEPLNLIDINQSTCDNNNDICYDTKFKVLFIKHFIQVIIGILTIILFFYILFGY